MEANVALSLPTCFQLPEELWHLIFADLTPDDFQSVTLALPLWDELLSSKKERVLFPLILQTVMDYLPFKTILDCRLVSKTVKSAVDEVFQYDASYPPPQPSSKLVKPKSHFLTRAHLLFHDKYTFNEPTEVSKFLRHFTSHRGNPLLTSYLDIRESVDPMEIYSTLLSKYGNQIKWMSFDMDCDTTAESATIFSSYLSHLPNLQRLTIGGGLVWIDEERRRRRLSLPSLRNVTYLDVEHLLNWNTYENNSSDDGALFLIRQCGAKLQKLECRGTLLACPQVSGEGLTELIPNVRNFAMRYQEFDEDRGGVISFSKFTSGFGWPLEKLRISSEIPLPVTQLISAINQFKDTLIELKISASLVTNEIVELRKVFADQMAVFPKLKMLKTKLINVNKSWIMEMLKEKLPNLQELSLVTGMVVFRADIESFQEGFEVLPNLKRVLFWFDRIPGSMETREFIEVTRDGYSSDFKNLM